MMPQSLVLSRNKENVVYPGKSQFYYMEVGFKGGSNLYRHVFIMKSLPRAGKHLWQQKPPGFAR